MKLNVTWQTKPFHELSVEELYQILQLRTEVFVVEQNCIFQDMDGKDSIALHLFGTFENQIIAYSRLYKPSQYYDNASIGRVVVCPKFRNHKVGFELMNVAILEIKKHFNETKITIGAQKYLVKFYESLGFKVSSAMYLEDGIEHVEMQKN